MRSVVLGVDGVLVVLEHVSRGEHEVREFLLARPAHREVLEVDVVRAPAGDEVGPGNVRLHERCVGIITCSCNVT